MRFSIIIPFQSHRSCALDCIRAWVATQKLPRRDYEIVAVLPVTDPDRLDEPIKALLRPHDRLMLSNATHDVAQSVEGAAASTGDYLVFTESHAWPEHDVLLDMLAEFERHPEGAALSCRTNSVAPTRLSRAESDHYDHDIDPALTGHPWRKVLNQIFVARRQAYFDIGGYDPELQHFAEWELATRYFDRGLAIGYAPHTRPPLEEPGSPHERSDMRGSPVSARPAGSPGLRRSALRRSPELARVRQAGLGLPGAGARRTICPGRDVP